MTSEAQKRYLRKKFAKEREEEKGCDCPGCESCTGFVRNCRCDQDLTWLKLRHGMDTGRQDADQPEDMGMGETDSERRLRETGFPF